MLYNYYSLVIINDQQIPHGTPRNRSGVGGLHRTKSFGKACSVLRHTRDADGNEKDASVTVTVLNP